MFRKKARPQEDQPYTESGLRKMIGRPEWWNRRFAVNAIVQAMDAGFEEKEDLTPFLEPEMIRTCRKAEIYCRLIGKAECFAMIWPQIRAGEKSWCHRCYFKVTEFIHYWVDHPDRDHDLIPARAPGVVTLYLEADRRGKKDIRTSAKHAQLRREGRIPKPLR